MVETVGVIVAGGQASRMNHLDKPLLPLAGKPLIQHVIDLARPQVADLVINVNRTLASYRQFQLPLVTDLSKPCEGPLIGIYSAMQWFIDQDIEAQYLACFPADVPAFPADIVGQLASQLQKQPGPAAGRDKSVKTVAWCQTGDQVQPLFSLWPFSLLTNLERAIERGVHGPRLFFRDHENVILQLPAAQAPQFFNINTPAELATAERMFARR
jgi:molybdopterin-guanine dinucleotide biosynthesis protein A